MLSLNIKRSMLGKRVSTIVAAPKQQTRPKRVHRGKMLAPVFDRGIKNRADQRIVAHLPIKGIHH